MQKYKVMFVCLGNICRSPAAQAALEDLVRREGLGDSIEAESSGVDAYHAGEQADSRMRRTAAARGVTINHRSRPFRSADLDEYDLILTMDSRNHRDVLSMCCSDEQRDKISMFRSFDPMGAGDVPDPWYGGPEGFENVWDILERTSSAVLDHISNR